MSKGSGVAIGLGAVVLLIVSGLLYYFVTHTPSPLPRPRAAAQSAASPELNIDVYVDGSESMRQFLLGSAGKTNYLQQFLRGLTTRMSSAHGNHSSQDGEWTNATVSYWKFGAFKTGSGAGHVSEAKLAEDDLRRLADNPGTEFNATRTPIEEPVKAVQSGSYPSNLKIIITDLYQSGGDTGTYANKLADYLDDASKAVAVIAVRNPFAGMVDDLPGCGTVQHAADTMPFYILLAGPVGDVHHAVKVLEGADGVSAAIGDNQTQEWFFTKAPQVLVADEQRPEVRIRDSRSRARAWKDLKLFKKSDYPKVEASEEQGITALTMRKGEKAEVSWSLPASEDGAGATAKPETRVVATRSAGKNRGTVEDKVAEGAVQTACESDAGSGEPMCFTIDESQLKTPDNYLFEFDAIAGPVLGSVLPAAMKPNSESMRKWNIEVAEAANVCRSGFAHKAGIAGERAGMTPQLSQFLLTLYDKRLNTKITTAAYSLYVKAR